MRTTSVFQDNQNQYSKQAFTDNYQYFGVNYNFAQTIANVVYTNTSLTTPAKRRFLATNSFETVQRFRNYGMPTVMFLYVLLYKSVLLAILSAIMFAFLLVFFILFKVFKHSLLGRIKSFFSSVLFFNLPMRYLQIVLLDLFISAFMTIRNLIRFDVESDIVFVSRTVD
jgi:hypothetical protein